MFSLFDAFEGQARLQKLLHGVDLPANIDELLSVYALGIYTELGEAMAINKNWKEWREKSKYDAGEFLEEIADVWIFLINFSLASGLTADDVLFEIERKQQILRERLKNNEIR